MPESESDFWSMQESHLGEVGSWQKKFNLVCIPAHGGWKDNEKTDKFAKQRNKQNGCQDQVNDMLHQELISPIKARTSGTRLEMSVEFGMQYDQDSSEDKHTEG